MRPTSLHIMSQHWSVTYHTDSDQPLIFGDEFVNKVGMEAMGYTNGAMQTMTVRGEPSCSFHAERDTLLHECLHALFSTMGIDMTDEAEEATICKITPGLLTLLRDNPGFVEYITQKEPEHVG